MFSIASCEEQVAQIAVDVFHSMLKMDVIVCGEPLPTISDVTALVRMEGSWNGALLIQCSFEQASECASRLMRIPAPVRFDEDAIDAMGELANMVGGNLKALLSPKSILSVPEVFSKTAISTLSVHHCKALAIALQSAIGIFHITLLEKLPFSVNEDGKLAEEAVNV